SNIPPWCNWQHAGLWCRVFQVRVLGAELTGLVASANRFKDRYSGGVSLTSPAAVIILAAGQGTRMKSATSKVLHSIGGRTLVGHVLHAAQGLDPQRIAVVVRHEREQVAAYVRANAPEAIIAD